MTAAAPAPNNGRDPYDLDHAEHPGPIARPNRLAGMIRRLCRRSARAAAADARGSRCDFVFGTLRPGTVMSLGPWRITYAEGHICLTHGGNGARVVITPRGADAAAYRAMGTDAYLPTLADEPLVITGQGDYRRAYPADQAAELRRSASEGAA